MKKSCSNSFLLIFTLHFITASTVLTTTQAQPPKSKEILLTAKAWKADEIRIQHANSTMEYYKRGGSVNSVNYDSDSLRFYLNKTGIYYFQGIIYKTKWKFIDKEKSKMTVYIYFPTPLTIQIENIYITQKHFRYAQYIEEGENSYLASCTRTPN